MQAKSTEKQLRLSLFRFLDAAAGDGLVCGNIDAAELFTDLFEGDESPLAMQASAPAPLEARTGAGIPIESDLRFVFGELNMAKIQGARSDSNKLLDSALARIERMIAEATSTKPAPTEAVDTTARRMFLGRAREKGNLFVFDDLAASLLINDIGCLLASSSTAASWQPMATAPKDSTCVLLKIEGGEHPLQDEATHVSLGSFGVEGGPTEDPTWNFAGWSWHQDCYCRGTGDPVGWMPLPEAPGAATSIQPAPTAAGSEADTTVDGGALRMALNVLRRAGKNEVADSLEDSAVRPAAATPRVELTDEQIWDIYRKVTSECHEANPHGVLGASYLPFARAILAARGKP